MPRSCAEIILWEMDRIDEDELCEACSQKYNSEPLDYYKAARILANISDPIEKHWTPTQRALHQFHYDALLALAKRHNKVLYPRSK
jgi:hypothetical protein